SPTAVKGKEQPVFERLAFNVQAKGTVANLARMERDFYKTNLLHQIRTVNVKTQQRESSGSAEEGLLDINMTVEALIVNGAKDRKPLLPPNGPYPPKVLAVNGGKERNYLAMDKNNMFTGYEPYRPGMERPAVEPKEDDGARVTE